MKPATPVVVPVLAVIQPEAEKERGLDADQIKRLAPLLTYREAEVAAQVCRGLSNKDAAKKLFVEEKTIKFHLTNIYKKTACISRAQLIVKMTAAK